MVEITIGENEKDQRLDRFLKKFLKKMPLSGIYKLMRNGVKVNGKRQKENYILKSDDVLTLYISEEELSGLTSTPKTENNIVHGKPVKADFDIAYEDHNIIVVGKPFGLLVHGDKREKKNTLDNRVRGYLMNKGEYSPNVEKTFSPAPVNRLDRNTTGLVIFGKNSETLREMNALWNDVSKYYLTVVSGKLHDDINIRGRLVKDEESNQVSVEIDDKNRGDISDAPGKYVQTFVKPLAVSRNERYSLLEIRLDTGRSHQIRGTLAAAGYPILGDSKYRGDKNRNMKAQSDGSSFGFTTQMLHAYKVKFNIKEGKLAYLDGKSVLQKPPGRFMEALRKIDIDFFNLISRLDGLNEK